MRLRWWQYVVGFFVAVLSIAAIVACLAGIAFAAGAASTWLTAAGFTSIVGPFVRVLLWAGLAVAALFVVAALVGMGIDIAESWLWPAPKGTRERP
jgi:hypothetical protein